MTVLNNEIRVATIEYAGDKRHQKAAHNFGKRWQQRNFKEQAKGFRNILRKFEAKLREVAGQHDGAAMVAGAKGAGQHGSELAEAINRDLERLDYDHAADIELIHSGICALLQAVECIAKSEIGRGRQPDRVRHQYVRVLAGIFEKRTRQKISPQVGENVDDAECKAEPKGAFHAFLSAVSDLLPEDLKLGGSWPIDHLIESYVSVTGQR